MKKTFIYIAIPIVVICAAFFAYDTAAAQDFYSDGGGWGGDSASYGDSSYGGGWGDFGFSGANSYGGTDYSSYGGGWGSSYDSGCGSAGCGSGISYGSGWDSSYGGSGCGSSGCGGSSYYGGSGFGFGLGFGGGCGMGGCGGGSSYFAPQNTNVTNRYNYVNTVTGSYNTNINSNTNINNNGGGTIIPPVYVPPVYYPPIYTPPPVYYPPPIYTPPPIACTVTFLNFSPTTFATEGQWYSYNLQAVSTLSNQISYRLVSGPDGLVVSPTGQVTWTPAFNQGRAASYEVRVAAYNGGCETNRTFYITVQDSNPVPPPPRPLPPPPKPVCCGCVPSTCAVAPKPIVTSNCPSVEVPVFPITPVTTVSNSAGFWASLGTAIAAMGAALSALLYSPFLLLLVIIVLGILLFRAYVRSRETTVII